MHVLVWLSSVSWTGASWYRVCSQQSSYNVNKRPNSITFILLKSSSKSGRKPGFMRVLRRIEVMEFGQTLTTLHSGVAAFAVSHSIHNKHSAPVFSLRPRSALSRFVASYKRILMVVCSPYKLKVKGYSSSEQVISELRGAHRRRRRGIRGTRAPPPKKKK